MDYQIKIESNLICITDTRALTPEIWMQHCEQIPIIANEAKISKILLIYQGEPFSIGTAKRFQYGTDIAKYFRGLKLAIVLDEPMREPRKFSETVAVNRGAKVRICGTVEEACSWLKTA